ncbi:hypothetical protein [Halosolutus gelatinilyticus]|uniref:hypothetical protein n=1 Tax=Halosolutus gelatinilyticus TaxID=2931975 RepID=UPI001FF4E1F6|nr:hypothetical protein [Halosolutus gelatinilyticus]
MTSDHHRRRFLQLAGTGAAASIAGCSRLRPASDDSDASNESDDGNGTVLDVGEEPAINPEDGITAIVQPPQEELATIEQEVMAEVEEGKLDRQEAQKEMIDRQRKLVSERSVAFESKVAGDDDLSIEAGIAERGAFLLDGSDKRLLDTLRNGEADGLIPGAEYAKILQARSQPASGPGQSDSNDNESANGSESADG